MLPKYRAEKRKDSKGVTHWYAMRGDEIASAPLTTKRAAEYEATRRMCSDLQYEAIKASLADEDAF